MAVYLLKMLEVEFDFELIWRVRRIESSWYLVYMLLLGNKFKQFLHGCFVNSQNHCPLVPRMTRWTFAFGLRPRAVVYNGHPRHLEVIVNSYFMGVW